MINSAVIMGRLTADPELRTTSSNISFIRFSVAVDRAYQRQGAERQTDFINVVAWRQTADFISKYFRKGQMIAVQGSIQTGSYEDKNGNKRSTFEIVADNVSFCGSKAETGASGASAYQTPASQPASYQNSVSEDFSDIVAAEVDLPF